MLHFLLHHIYLITLITLQIQIMNVKYIKRINHDILLEIIGLDID